MITKAIIPVAGLGTRFLPATKAQPKEMLAIVDKPVIQYLVEEAVASGITDIIFVTGRSKRAIEDHFDYAPELEQVLEEKGKKDLLALVRQISDMARFSYVRQKEPRGDGDAILSALHLVGDEPVAVLFGDDIVDSKEPCLKQLISVFERYGNSVVALDRVGKKDVGKFGVVDAVSLGDGVYEVKDLIEKPKPEEAPSDLAIVGKYIVTPEVLSVLSKIQKPKGEELRLADALKIVSQKGGLHGLEFEGTRYDCGSKIGFLKATVEFGLKHKEIQEEFSMYLRGRAQEK
ncbi:UTP--glucose-1-phosphate uridylyltransferase [Candidatus Jorgensenbacteria bacterium RIFCSPLOWO2_01_FULL_45_25b]|uniref:UTP--glucose-1-phosphate uridylyltransferase n=1 Tax=Candidatus Jorgensenbacteria bacterium RIFCSPLOWO2_01_FULL_45_25b TaxID=1798471 RepID=A0A1F6BY08_9BACT|nr:MAG: UTP--glucose-1-phosphate uridylyltransferase [Candidatus Jorgensenbacteria bacterium RIFCSPLOWO2_01_FULL_45_25b]